MKKSSSSNTFISQQETPITLSTKTTTLLPTRDSAATRASNANLTRKRTITKSISRSKSTSNTTRTNNNNNTAPAIIAGVSRKQSIKSISHSIKSFKSSILATPPVRRKLICIGDSGVGKTSLLSVYSTGAFPDTFVPTIFENYVSLTEIDEKFVELCLWDTAGQEDYSRLRPLSYPDTDCIILCFSIDSVDSYKNIETKWIPEINQYVPTTAIILVGLKADQRDNFTMSRTCIQTSMGRKLASAIGAVQYLEASAKTGHGVDQVIEAATRW